MKTRIQDALGMGRRLIFAAAACAAFVAAPQISAAQEWPEQGKPLTIIVPFGAGGPADLYARLLGAELETELGLTVQVENRPGAGTQVGLTELALSDPDGYTIGVVSTPNIFPIYMDPARQAVFGRDDLTMIGMQVEDTGILTVKADSPFTSLQDLVAAAKETPDEITVSATPMGQSQLQVLQLQKLAGVELAHVQFDGGAATMTALLGGHVDVHSGTLPDVFAQIEAGNLRALAVTSRERSPFLPDVPTMEEQGFPVFWGSARIYAARSGTPDPVVARLREAFEKAMQSVSMQERIKAAGGQYRFMNADETAQYLAEAEETAAPLITETLNR